MKRKHIQFNEDPSVEFVIHEDGHLHVEINDDWCGSTESGFDATLLHVLNPNQVDELRKFLKTYDGAKPIS